MELVVADTSALVSLGTVADHPAGLFDHLLDDHEVVVPEQVVEELRETAAFDDPSGRGAGAVLDRLSDVDVRPVAIDETFPLDDGENAAVTLANSLGATQFRCDEFSALALVHASLSDTRLVTTPSLVAALVRTGRLDAAAALDLLEAMADARSWAGNAYVERVRTTIQVQQR